MNYKNKSTGVVHSGKNSSEAKCGTNLSSKDYQPTSAPVNCKNCLK